MLSVIRPRTIRRSLLLGRLDIMIDGMGPRFFFSFCGALESCRCLPPFFGVQLPRQQADASLDSARMK